MRSMPYLSRGRRLHAKCNAAASRGFDDHHGTATNILALRAFGLCPRSVPRNNNMIMSETHSDRVPEVPEGLVPEDAAEVAPRDSEIDFDDETDDDQLTLDVVEAAEVGALLDDPESMSPDEM